VLLFNGARNKSCSYGEVCIATTQGFGSVNVRGCTLFQRHTDLNWTIGQSGEARKVIRVDEEASRLGHLYSIVAEGA